MTSTSNLDIIITEDGSNSVFSNFYKEQYHSTHGAIQESKHIFIEAGLKTIIENKKEINILEIGFGTGLNALMTLHETKQMNVKVNYTSFEAYPIVREIYCKLNFASFFNLPNEEFLKLHEVNWNEIVQITENFSIQKLNQKIEDAELPINKFDLVYFDAFSPEIQPELWTEIIFAKLFDSMKNNAVLTTYSAKGIVKRALKSAGFFVENIPGPPGKREITREKKIEIVSNNL
jgi:tRNA U34 5-methylaminomethyl-2-thiouridine-forming methyltransferase MnmC